MLVPEMLFDLGRCASHSHRTVFAEIPRCVSNSLGGTIKLDPSFVDERVFIATKHPFALRNRTYLDLSRFRYAPKACRRESPPTPLARRWVYVLLTDGKPYLAQSCRDAYFLNQGTFSRRRFALHPRCAAEAVRSMSGEYWSASGRPRSDTYRHPRGGECAPCREGRASLYRGERAARR